MHNLKQRLPPLDPLVAFEAAARHLSFTRAARELNLSQAAVSQQIRTLEHSLGVPLFIRAHRSVSLSASGREYQHTISNTLRQIAVASEDLRASPSRARLVIAADQSIASLWLMSRLPDFQNRFPGDNLRLVVSDEERDCLADDVAVSIIHGTGDWPGFHSQELFAEEVFPVCSPAFAQQHGPLATPQHIIGASLLELDDTHWDWMNWRIWLSGNGVDLPAGNRRLQINSYPLLMEAARNGQGIALGWRHLVDDMLVRGDLVRPMDAALQTDFGYYLVWPDRSESTDNALAFRSWAKQQAAAQACERD